MTSEDYRSPLPSIPESIAAARESLKRVGAKPSRLRKTRPVPDGPREELSHGELYDTEEEIM